MARRAPDHLPVAIWTIAVAVIVTLATAGCAIGTRGPTAKHGVPPAAEAALSDARAVGSALLASARLPADSRRIAGSTSTQLTAPLSTLGCSLPESHEYWRVAGTLDGISAFLRAHPGADLVLSGYGTGWDRSVEVNAVVDDHARTDGDAGSELVLSLAPDGATSVDIRVDAEVVVSGVQCARFGPRLRSSALTRRGSS